MDTNCNTDCDALGEVVYGKALQTTFTGGDDCPREAKSIVSRYPAIQNPTSATTARLRSGHPVERIETPYMQESPEVLRPLIVIGDSKTIKGFIPKESGRIIVKKNSEGFRIVSGKLTNLIQLETAVTADFVLAGNGIKKVCKDDPCPCSEGINLLKIPIESEPPPEILAVDDEDETEYMTPVNIAVLTNDTGDGLEVISAGPSDDGVIDIEIDGTITFTPNMGVTGEVSFTYTIEDDHGQTDTATVTVTVGAAPEIAAVNDSIETDFETPHNFDPRTNDTGIGLSVILVTDPPNGTATIEMDGTVTYTPDAEYDGPDSFDYTVEDDYGQQDTATVNVTVNEEVVPPSVPTIIEDCTASCDLRDEMRVLLGDTAIEAVEAWLNCLCYENVTNGQDISELPDMSKHGGTFNASGDTLPVWESATTKRTGVRFDDASQELTITDIPITSNGANVNLSAVIVFTIDPDTIPDNTTIFEVVGSGGTLLKLEIAYVSDYTGDPPHNGKTYRLIYTARTNSGTYVTPNNPAFEWIFSATAEDRKHIFVGAGFDSAGNYVMSHRVAGIQNLGYDDSTTDHNHVIGTTGATSLSVAAPDTVDITFGPNIQGMKIHEFVLFSRAYIYDSAFADPLDCLNTKWSSDHTAG